MIADSVHIPIRTAPFDMAECLKGSWLVLLHVHRLPPHVALAIDGNYNSLTVKGHELDVPLEAVYKTSLQKKIETVFIRLLLHPVFSNAYQLAVLQELIQKFPCVRQGEATCLSPIREFFQEFYAVPLKPDELLFDFMLRLSHNGYLDQAVAFNFELEEGVVALPCYTNEALHERIRQERRPFYNDPS